jgi:hypothetical protein
MDRFGTGPDGNTWSGMDDDHFSAGLIGLHNPVRFVDLVEAKYAGRFDAEPPVGHLVCDVLERHVRQREPRRSEDEAAEKGEVCPSSGFLRQRAE